jgi:DNA polymerase III, epsilon subunit, Proteobacterial
MRQIVLDTETTGLEAQNGDRILEIGCVELLNRRLTGNNRHYYINPERDSHEDALRVHGITTEFLKDKPLFKDIAQEFIDFIKDSELIIHNASFDIGFINKEFKLLGLPSVEEMGIPVIDSLMLARTAFPGKRNSLDALCDRFEIDNSGRVLHGALLDSELLAEVYIHLTRGQHALLGEESSSDASANQQQANHIDLSTLTIPVITPSAEELQQHQEVMQAIAKASGDQVVWKDL